MSVRGLSKVERRKKRIDNSSLVKQANAFICAAFELWKLSPSHTVAVLVDEMIHSILFTGHILDLKIEPEEMFAGGVREILNAYFGTAKKSFKTQLPKRTPFSCMLNLVAEIKAKGNKTSLIETLSKITEELHCSAVNQLLGSAVCITHSEDFQQIFSYGASIPKAEKRYKEIWIDLSCVHTWHPRVSYAVMQCSRKEVRTETFPSLETFKASCTAYDAKQEDLQNLTKKEPCQSCCELFSLEPPSYMSSGAPNLYGNCAETEAISELFRLRRVPLFDTRTLIKFAILRNGTQNDLIRRLKNVGCYGFDADVIYQPTIPVIA